LTCLIKPKDSSIFFVFSAARSSFVRSVFKFRNLFRAVTAWRAAPASGYVPVVSTRRLKAFRFLSLARPIVMPAIPKICPTIIFAPRFNGVFSVSWSVAAQ